jgi:hypothetical protein
MMVSHADAHGGEPPIGSCTIVLSRMKSVLVVPDH